MPDQLGSPVRPLIERPTYPLTLTRVRRTFVQWGLDSGLIPTFETWLRALDLDDPTSTENEPKAAASAYWRRAQALAEDARRVQPEEPTRSISALLAEGTLTTGDARKMLVKRPDAREAEKLVREQRNGLSAGSRAALLRALQAIYDYTEDGWLEVLRPIVADALANRDDRRFNLAHGFAAWLREPTRNKVFGLTAATNRRFDAERYLYSVARPDLLHRWRVERATDTERHEQARYSADGMWRVQYALTTSAPFPMLRDYDEAWGAGLYSADEVIANTERSRAEQERTFAKLAPAPATPTKTRHRIAAL